MTPSVGEAEGPEQTLELAARIENSFGPFVMMKLQRRGGDAPDDWHLVVTYSGLNYGVNGPVYEDASLDLKPSDVHRIFSVLREMRLPARVARTWGLDGTSYSIQTREGFNTSRFEWGETIPSGWEPLAEVMELLKAYLPPGIDHRSQ